MIDVRLAAYYLHFVLRKLIPEIQTLRSSRVQVSCTLYPVTCSLPYFEYSSTISCSFTGRLMSSRFGNDSTLPLKLF
jgi:hypothetical protein